MTFIEVENEPGSDLIKKYLKERIKIINIFAPIIKMKKPGRNQIAWEEYLPAQTRHDTMTRMSKHCPKIIWPFSILCIFVKYIHMI